MKTSIQPLQSRVLIRALPEPPSKESRIIIPETVKEKPMEHEVVAVGPDVTSPRNVNLSSLLSALKDAKFSEDLKTVSFPKRESKALLNPGDHVLVSKYAGTELQVDGEALRIVEESDILAKVNRK